MDPEHEHVVTDAAVATDGEEFLRGVGDRLRLARARRGMPRRLLAARSNISERYIAQMEAGRGNGSILLLRALCAALDIPLSELLGDPPPLLEGLLSRLTAAQIDEARVLLLDRFEAGAATRGDRIALIGLRGAGKSTLGRALASHRGVPFHELDAEIEQAAGMTLAALFERHGQAGYRRLERAALDRVIALPAAVIATGGGIVTSPATFDRLLSFCRTIWVRATPDEHMRRVVDQGDLRPMQETPNSMRELRAILASREALYARADLVLDTSGQPLDDSIRALAELAATKAASRHG